MADGHTVPSDSSNTPHEAGLSSLFVILYNHIINVGCDDGSGRVSEVVADKFWYPPHLSVLTEKPQVAIIQPMRCYYVTSLSIHTMLSFCTDVMVFVTCDDPSSMT